MILIMHDTQIHNQYIVFDINYNINATKMFAKETCLQSKDSQR
jgi:hypothetical protein